MLALPWLARPTLTQLKALSRLLLYSVYEVFFIPQSTFAYGFLYSPIILCLLCFETIGRRFKTRLITGSSDRPDTRDSPDDNILLLRCVANMSHDKSQKKKASHREREYYLCPGEREYYLCPGNLCPVLDYKMWFAKLDWLKHIIQLARGVLEAGMRLNKIRWYKNWLLEKGFALPP